MDKRLSGEFLGVFPYLLYGDYEDLYLKGRVFFLEKRGNDIGGGIRSIVESLIEDIIEREIERKIGYLIEDLI